MFAEQWSAREQDIAQEWIQRDSEKRCLGRLFGCCPFSCYRRMTILCYYVTYFTVGVIATAVLVVMAILIFQPFKPALDYNQTDCMTHEKKRDKFLVECSCGSGCMSEYPCMKLYVWFITDEGENVTSMIKDTNSPESCTFTPFCERDKEKNAQRVEEYDQEHGTLGVQIPCFYDPKDATNVILKRAKEPLLPYIVLVGPGVAALLCALAFFMVYHVCGCRYVCRMTPPEDVKAEASANPLVAADLTPAGIVMVPSNQTTGDGASQVPLVDNNKEEA